MMKIKEEVIDILAGGDGHKKRKRHSKFVLRRESIFTIIIIISFEIKNLGLVYLFGMKQWAAVRDE